MNAAMGAKTLGTPACAKELMAQKANKTNLLRLAVSCLWHKHASSFYY